MKGRLVGYVRCSTKEQCPDRQIIAMRKFGVPDAAIMVEMTSGKNFRRPTYQKLINQLNPGDTLVISSLDRLGRDYNTVIEQWNLINKELGAHIVVLDMPLLDTRQKNHDLTTSFVADLVLQILSYVSEKELELNRARQAEGIAAAKTRGVKFGRKPLEPPDEFIPTKKLWEKGRLSASKAAQRLGVSRPTFISWISKY